MFKFFYSIIVMFSFTFQLLVLGCHNYIRLNILVAFIIDWMWFKMIVIFFLAQIDLSVRSLSYLCNFVIDIIELFVH